MRWLKEVDWRGDPTNARCNLRWNSAVLEAIAAGDNAFNVFRHALQEADATGLSGITFVPQDGSYRVAGVEMGMHGDDGTNGARATINNLAKVTMKMNVGHSHTAGILDEIYQAGMNGQMQQGYNHGSSSWTPTDILTYASGKRTLITKRRGKWRAA